MCKKVGEALSWQETFNAKRMKMTPLEDDYFQDFVNKAYHAYHLPAGKKTKTSDLVTEQKRASKQQKEGLNWWHATENLGEYLNPKEACFGTFTL